MRLALAQVANYLIDQRTVQLLFSTGLSGRVSTGQPPDTPSTPGEAVSRGAPIYVAYREYEEGQEREEMGGLTFA
jgi:hypothetical protein